MGSPKFNDQPVCGESSANTRTMYMYRAQSDSEYPMENVNMADLPGVLWYLHHEVVTMCPRKNDITRILRMKVTLQHFVSYVAMDNSMCTTPDVPMDQVTFP